jgi:5'-phosphate synthase pdxT subunit
MTVKVGVLALQGAFREHLETLEGMGVVGVAVKCAEDFKEISGLIIPGGESTTIDLMLDKLSLRHLVEEWIKADKPTFGTCAGLILLARMDNFVSVERNAFGSQIHSFVQDLSVSGLESKFPAVFIRAPVIRSVADNVEILSTCNNHIVAVRKGHLLGTAFHPELTNDTRLHKMFINSIDL